MAKHTIIFFSDTGSADLREKWEEFVDRHPRGNFFQSPAFIDLFDHCLNYQPLVWLAMQPNGEVNGVLVALAINHRIYGLPFQRVVIQGGPIAGVPGNDRQEILRGLLGALKSKTTTDAVFVEIRNHQHDAEEDAIFTESGFSWHDHLNSILAVPSAEEALRGFSDSKQRQIRKGFEHGAIVQPASSLVEVEAFYGLLKDHYRKKVRKPLPPLTFFRNFYRQTQMNGKGVILLVKYKERLLGGMVCPFSPPHTVHEWYIASVRDEMKHLYPGVLTTWAGIEYALNHGFGSFDFMGMGTPQTPYGTRNFKSQFGGEVRNSGRWRLVYRGLRYRLGVMGYSLIKRISKG